MRPLLRQKLLLIAAAALAIAAISPGVSGQTEPGDPPPAGAAPPAEKLPTKTEIQSRIDVIQADASLDAELKASLIDAYQKTLERLGDVETWSAKAAEYEQTKQSAPGLIETIRAELAQPIADPKLEATEELSTADVNLKVSAAQAELDAAKQAAAQLEADAKSLADRRMQAPKDLAAARQRLDEATANLNLPPSSEQPAELQAANRVRLQARQRAIQQEIQHYEREIGSLDIRSQLLTSRRDRAARKIAEAEKALAAWNAVAAERLKREQEAAAQDTQRKMREAAEADPAIKQIAQVNAQLSAQRSDKQDGVLTRITAETERLTKVREDLESISKMHDRLRLRVQQSEEFGISDALGQQLRQQRANLPDIRRIKREIQAQNERSADIQGKLAELEEMERELRDIQPRLDQIEESLPERIPDEQMSAIIERGRQLLEEQRTTVRQLQTDYEYYLETLTDLHHFQGELIREVREFRAFVDERVLWIRSNSNLLLAKDDLAAAREAVLWLGGPDSTWLLVSSLTTDFRDSTAIVSLFLLIWILLVVLQPRLRSRLKALAGVAPGSPGERITQTIGGLIIGAVIAATGPALLLLISWRLIVADAPGELEQSVAYGLQRAAALWFSLEFLRQLMRRGGIGEKHFRWRPDSARLLRRNLFWLLIAAVPCSFVVWSMQEQTDEAARESLGRLAFIVAMLALIVVAFRIFRPRGALMGQFIARQPGGWLDRLRFIWFPGLVALPVAVVALAAAGYYYTALRLEQQIQYTVVLILVLVLISAVMARWVALARRKLAIEQYRRRQTAAAEAKPGEAAAASTEPPTEQVDLWAISTQAQALIRSFIIFGVIIVLWTVWADELPALAALEEVKLWGAAVVEPAAGATESILPMNGESAERDGASAATAEEPANLRDLLFSVIILTLTFLAARNLPGLLEIVILQRLPITHSSRYAAATIARYVIVIIGIVIAFNNIGIGWSKVQWIAAAITVGLGFGLQETIANFVSGLILLFEQPIRVGDVVTVGDRTGTVTRIRIRATTIVDWDRKELVIPNKEFVTGQIVNWSLSDPLMRLRLPVGIAYGSNTALARSLLLEVAQAHPRVLSDPEPVAVMLGFGDSALNFELRVFLPTIDDWIPAQNELLLAIDRKFREHHIEIAFPQRDIHIRSIQGELAVNAPKPAPSTSAPGSASPT